MTTNRLIAKLRNTWRDFARAKDGNTVVVFALAFIPIMGLTGAAVDYSHASLIKTSMQAAGDTTALAIAQSVGSQSFDAQAMGNNYFKGLFKRTDVHDLVVTGTYDPAGSTIVIKATAIYDTSIMGVMGPSFRHIPLTIWSTSSFGSTRLRVALVLDNTGSMAQSNKLGALKNATTNTTNGLLTQLRNAASTNGDVYVSIIPFVKDVNVDRSNYNASWIYWDDAAHTDNKSWDANNGSCSVGNYNTRPACLAASGGTCSISGYTSQNSCTGAGVCSDSTYTTQNSCTGAGSCSISGYTTQISCTAAVTGSCSISGYTTQSSCTGVGTCNNSNYTDITNCLAHGYCSDPTHHSQNGCNNAHATWHNQAIWTPHPGVWTTHNGVWTAHPGVWTFGVWSPPAWTPDNHNTWNGCVMDRGDPNAPNGGNYDQNVLPPTAGTPASLFAAEQYSACPQAVMGLSYNWTSMTTEVNDMVANGSTNQSIGLSLGWMSLAGGGPFTVPPLDPRSTYTQVIILLTDGLNTQDRWYGDGIHTASQVDTRQQVTCDNIKRAGITIYTIQVNTQTPADPTSTLLQGCAGSTPGVGDPSKFFLLTSSTQIVTAFNQIGTQLSKLRIAR